MKLIACSYVVYGDTVLICRESVLCVCVCVCGYRLLVTSNHQCMVNNHLKVNDQTVCMQMTDVTVVLAQQLQLKYLCNLASTLRMTR